MWIDKWEIAIAASQALVEKIDKARTVTRTHVSAGRDAEVECVETFVRLRSAGLDGLALGMINYVNDFSAIRDELLPRMQRVGLREASANSAEPDAVVGWAKARI